MAAVYNFLTRLDSRALKEHRQYLRAANDDNSNRTRDVRREDLTPRRAQLDLLISLILKSKE
jgi:hypothetical protein